MTGVEPWTFGLRVESSDQLSHAGLLLSHTGLLLSHTGLLTETVFLWNNVVKISTFLVHFCAICGQYLDHIRTTFFVTFWTPFGPFLGHFTATFWTFVGPFLKAFGQLFIHFWTTSGLHFAHLMAKPASRYKIYRRSILSGHGPGKNFPPLNFDRAWSKI